MQTKSTPLTIEQIRKQMRQNGRVSHVVEVPLATMIKPLLESVRPQLSLLVTGDELLVDMDVVPLSTRTENGEIYVALLVRGDASVSIDMGPGAEPKD
jgi:hypothetical protein